MRKMMGLAVALAAALGANAATLTPVKATAEQGKKKSFVYVTWNRYTDENAYGYRIYRGTSQYISQAKRIADVSATTSSLCDYGAAAAIKYWYFVLPLDRYNNVATGELSSETYTRYSGQGWKWSSARFVTSTTTVAVGGELPLYFVLNDEYIRPNSVTFTTAASAERAEIVYYKGLTDDDDVREYAELQASGAFAYLKGIKDGTVYVRATHGVQTYMLTINVKMPSYKLYAPEKPDIINDDDRLLYFKFNNRFELPNVECISGDSCEIFEFADVFGELQNNAFGILWTLDTGRTVYSIGYDTYDNLYSYEPYVVQNYPFTVKFYTVNPERASDVKEITTGSALVTDCITWAIAYGSNETPICRENLMPYSYSLWDVDFTKWDGDGNYGTSEYFADNYDDSECPYFLAVWPTECYGYMTVSGTVKGVPVSGTLKINQ